MTADHRRILSELSRLKVLTMETKSSARFDGLLIQGNSIKTYSDHTPYFGQWLIPTIRCNLKIYYSRSKCMDIIKQEESLIKCDQRQFCEASLYDIPIAQVYWLIIVIMLFLFPILIVMASYIRLTI